MLWLICDDPSTINMNDYEGIPNLFSQWVIYEVCFERLCQKVIEAEESAREFEKEKMA